MRDPDVHSNDFAGCPEGFQVAALALWAELAQAARRYAVACALALGLERDYFARSLSRMDLCTLRFLHYPPCDMPSEAAVDGGGAAIRVGEHTDFGAYTFLLLGEGARGLQLKPVDGGEVGGSAGGEAGGWIDAVLPARPAGTVGAVVNTGALMARWTNDTWRATAHRVVVPTAEVAAAHRYSIACFIDPDAEAAVAVDERFVPPGEAPRYGPTTGLEFLLMKLREAQGAVGTHKPQPHEAAACDARLVPRALVQRVGCLARKAALRRVRVVLLVGVRHPDLVRLHAGRARITTAAQPVREEGGRVGQGELQPRATCRGADFAGALVAERALDAARGRCVGVEG